MVHPVAAFDLDGTLVDTAPDLVEALTVSLATIGLGPLPEGMGRKMIGRGARAMIVRALEYHGVPIIDEQVEPMLVVFLDHYTANISARSRPFPGVEKALDRLSAAGVRLAVCTNKFESLSRQLLGELGLESRFAAVVGPDTLGAKKPDPAHVVGAIERAGGDVRRAVMIGDSELDVAAAKAAGVPVIAVEFGYTERPVSELGADHVIAHYDALWGVVAEPLGLVEA